MSVLSEFRERYLVRFWSPIPAFVALGVASAYYFAITGTFWAVTGEFTRWGGHVLAWFGYRPEEWSYFKLIGLQGTPFDRIDGVMIVGMLLGALAHQPPPAGPGFGRRHYRRLRCASCHGLQSGCLFYRYTDVLVARMGVHAGDSGRRLGRCEDMPTSIS